MGSYAAPCTSSSQPNVIVSGWQVYNNKGEVVEKFEPFYAKGYTYAHPSGSQYGAKIRMFYDPRGRLVKTINADDTETRVIFGEPQATNLSPDGPVKWNPWDTFTYDANDLDSTSISHNTPDSQAVDCLGRVVEQVRRIKSDATNPAVQAVTRFTYDIRGNLLQVFDAERELSFPAFTYGFDLLNRQLYRFNIDQGTTQTVFDPAGNVIEIDSIGEGGNEPAKCSFGTFNNINQPLKVWKLNAGTPLFAYLRQEYYYGDQWSKFLNCFNKVIMRYDEGGRTELPSYDFKGNPEFKISAFFDDGDFDTVITNADYGGGEWRFYNYEIIDRFCTSSDTYTQEYTYDALNRLITLQAPGANYSYHYDRGGQLHKLIHTPTGQTARSIELYYNAKGQNLLEYMSNGLMTRYRYDKKNFRLMHSNTESGTKTVTSTTITFHAPGDLVQNMYYSYDKVGNVLDKQNIMPEDKENYAFHQTAEYDSLYRLLKSTGIEADYPDINLPYQDNTPGLQPGQRKPYEQYYEYDKVGNILSLDHCRNNVTVFKRVFGYEGGKNRLQDVNIGSDSYGFKYDECGNVTNRELSTQYVYNQQGQLIFMKVQAGDVQPSKVVMYTYNAEGQRTKKYIWKGPNLEETTIYLDGIFEKSTKFGGLSQTYTHMAVGDRKLFSYRTGDLMDDLTAADKWTMQDALGSVSCTTDGNGTVLSVECYYAFGETAFGSYTKKRYRYCGKERDGETGLYYYGARYYDAWTCRFVSVDPMADEYAYLSPYNYAGNNPISYMDVDGMQSEANEKSPSGGGSQTSSGGPVVKPVDESRFTFLGKIVHSVKRMVNSIGQALKNGLMAVKEIFAKRHAEVEIDFSLGEDSPATAPSFSQKSSRKHSGSVQKQDSATPRATRNDSQKTQFDIDKAVKHVQENAKTDPEELLEFHCARYVRRAINAGGVKTPNNPVPARLYEGYLPSLGFEEITTDSFQPGDLAVFQGYPGGTSGKNKVPYRHIQMYDGKKWISDRVQNGFWPGTRYKNESPYSIFRWKGTK